MRNGASGAGEPRSNLFPAPSVSRMRRSSFRGTFIQLSNHAITRNAMIWAATHFRSGAAAMKSRFSKSRGPVGGLVGNGGAVRFPADHTGQTQQAHPSVHRPRRHLEPAPPQAGQHFAAPTQPFRGQLASAGPAGAPDNLPDRLNRPGVRQPPSRPPSTTPAGNSVGPPGDLAALLPQDPADRLDRVAFASHLFDEPDDQRLRGASPPAKKTVAARRISTSSRSRLFSASSYLISV